MKTPEQAMRAFVRSFSPLVEIRCALCPYRGMKDCQKAMTQDVYEHIQQFETSYEQVSKALCSKEKATLEEILQAVSQVKNRLAQVERERDALMESVKGCCETCAFVGDCAKHDPDPTSTGAWWYDDCEEWQWRGVCPENTKEEN